MSFQKSKNFRLKNFFLTKIAGSWGDEPSPNANNVVCLRVADIITDQITYKKSQLTFRSYKNDDLKNRILEIGDLILEKSGGGEKQPVGRIAFFSLDQKSTCSNFLEILKPNRSLVNPKYISYVMYSLWKSRVVTKHIKQTTGIQNLDLNSYLSEYWNLPDLNTQQKIADYLDRETARIDALIEAKEKMLSLLEEKRRTLISRAVTKGLDPEVKMKDSGIEWLGEIPVHWEVERAKHIFYVRDERTETGDEELLTVSHITGVTPRSEKQVYMFESEDKVGYKKCYPGDLVINTLWAWMGAMGVAPNSGIVSPDYHVYVTNGTLIPEFIDFLCRSKPFVAEVNRWSKGVWSSRLRLYPENFFEIELPIPPCEEQKQIVNYIDTFAEKSLQLSKEIEKSIALLKERRAALISAAVTRNFELSCY